MDRTSWLSLGVLAAVLALVILGGLASSRRADAYTTPPPFTIGDGGASAGGLDASGGSFGSASFSVSGAGGADGTYSAATYWNGQTIGGLAIDALDATGLFDGGLSDILGAALTAYGLYVDAQGHVYTSNPDDPQYRKYAGCSQSTTACYVVGWEDSLPYNGLVSGPVGFTSASDAISYMESVEPAAFNLFFGPKSDNCGTSGGTDEGPVVEGDSVFTTGTCKGAAVQELIGSYSVSQGAAAPSPPLDQPQLATPQQIAQALAAEDPGIAPELVNNAQGQEFNTPNVQQAATQLGQQIATQTGQPIGDPEPAPESSTSPAPTSTSLIEPAPSSSAPQSAPTANLPAFCSWAAVVCDAINWMEQKPIEKPAPQLPVNPAPAGSSWSSGLGGGACPAPYPFQVFGVNYSLDLSPLCTLMTDIRGLVLAACGLIAAYILAGTTRRG